MILTDTYIQVYSNVDKAIVDFIHNNLYFPFDETKSKVTCVFSTPERAFAQVWKRLNPQGDKKISIQKKIPLPFISINRVPGWSYDASRDNNFTIQSCNDDGTFDTTPWPTPIKIQYTISFWSRNLMDEDGLLMQFYKKLQMGARYSLTIDYPRPIGEKYGTFSVVGDNRLEPIVSESDQRIMRRDLTISLESFLTNDYTETDVIETVHTHLEDSVTEDDYGTVIVDENGLVT